MSGETATDTVTMTGTITACGTRFSTAHGRAIVTEFQANWVVVVEVSAADPDAPFAAGEQAAFLFHSPTHLFFASAEEVVGRTYRFSLLREIVAERVRWTDLRAKRIE